MMTRPRKIRSLAIAVIPSLVLFSLQAQAQDLPVGKIIERVVCLKDTGQSYALYLPPNYTTDRRWPVIYAFDPAARGLRPVERFKDAAEKYGYIIVGSNNSRNLPDRPLAEIINAMFDDTQTRFSIDQNRVYTAGMSGGARVAGMVAQSLAQSLRGGAAGVILCGAGFSEAKLPEKPLPFPVFGVAGVEDFNWIELRQLHRALDSIGSANRFVTFDGDHTWAPSDSCLTAVEWMELQAMRLGRRERDEKLIAELFDKMAGQARADESAKRVYEAFLKYEAIARDFNGLREAPEFAQKADELRSSKEVKDHLKQEKAAEQTQRQRSQEFFAAREQLKTAENPAVAMIGIKSMISDLRKKAASRDESVERLAARRALGSFYVSMNEEANRHRAAKKYQEAATSLTLAAEIRPDNPQIFFSLARACALGGDKRQALEALKKAVELGFTNADEIAGNADFASIRNEAAYKRMIEDARRKAQNEKR
jgi:pimeloyl-ACP methyl ester carboxylesterase/Flp pilus assembly protein TadD